ncbi:DUF4863 family protein [Rhodobacterales bacterium HKCCE2091]|nr:DUF4863 family protein [Rhodobacterales bacterium HKCCE2091]
MSQQLFTELVDSIASHIAATPLDGAMEDELNRRFGPRSEVFRKLTELCAAGEAEGWLMAREAGGIKYGRAVKPGGIAGNFSVDVVRMKDVRGPHHVHTRGEIGAVMPLSGSPRFDGRSAGWYVYGPGSDHHPTVEGGDAYVLYLLPEGEIEFTGR